jgi:hypothetical protein
MGAAARKLETVPRHAPATLPARRRKSPVRHPEPGRRRPASPTRPVQRRRLVGRGAHAVGRLPESAAIRRISKSRLWIAVIGVLLIGIVLVNVLTVSYGAMASRVETNTEKLQRQNTILSSSTTRALSMPRVRRAAAEAGMIVPATTEITYREFGPEVFATAAQRLAAEGG